MSKQREGLGVFGALVTVLIIMGIAAWIADLLGVLPHF